MHVQSKVFSTDLIKSLPDMAGVGTSIHLVYTGLKLEMCQQLYPVEYYV